MEKNDEKKVVKQEIEEKDLEQATGGKRGGPCPFILLQEQGGDEKQWFFNGKLKIMEKKDEQKAVKQELDDKNLEQATGGEKREPLHQYGDPKYWFSNGKLKIMEKQKDKKIVKQELSEDDLNQATGCGGCKPLVKSEHQPFLCTRLN